MTEPRPLSAVPSPPAPAPAQPPAPAPETPPAAGDCASAPTRMNPPALRGFSLLRDLTRIKQVRANERADLRDGTSGPTYEVDPEDPCRCTRAEDAATRARAIADLYPAAAEVAGHAARYAAAGNVVAAESAERSAERIAIGRHYAPERSLLGRALAAARRDPAPVNEP